MEMEQSLLLGEAVRLSLQQFDSSSDYGLA